MGTIKYVRTAPWKVVLSIVCCWCTVWIIRPPSTNTTAVKPLTRSISTARHCCWPDHTTLRSCAFFVYSIAVLHTLYWSVPASRWLLSIVGILELSTLLQYYQVLARVLFSDWCCPLFVDNSSLASPRWTIQTRFDLTRLKAPRTCGVDEVARDIDK